MNNNPKIKHPKVTLAIGILIIGISLFGFFRNTDVNKDNLLKITGHLKKTPILDHSQIKGANYYDYDINLIEFPCTFRISDNEYHAINLQVMEGHSAKGDILSLYIFREDQVYIKSSDAIVQTYGLSSKDENLYDFDYRNKLYRKDSWYNLFLAGIGIIICLYTMVKNIYVSHGIAIGYAFLYILYLFLFVMS
jgi:hypothetical protein